MPYLKAENELAKQVCAALGLDYNAVHSLTLRWAVGDVTTVEVGMYVPVEGDVLLRDIIRRYRMVPIEATDG